MQSKAPNAESGTPNAARQRRQGSKAPIQTASDPKNAGPSRRASAPPSLEKDRGYLRSLIHDGDEKDRSAIEYLIAEMADDDRPDALFILIEAVLYFERVGDAKRALELAKVGLRKALDSEEVSLQRKAYNVAGFCYSRVGDYKQALIHLERALSLAMALKEPLSEFAVLCNVVDVLQVMGLVEDAKSLSVRLLKYPQGTADLDYLHLQNAINGLKLSRRVGDMVHAACFDEVAQEKLQFATAVGRPWQAYVDANRSLWLLKQGKSPEALNLIRNAIKARPPEANFRVDIILFCAQASCALKNRDAELICESKSHLQRLLEKTHNFAPHREDVLRSLVELYSNDGSVDGIRLESLYLRRLREHIITVKHRQFFASLNSCDELPALRIGPPIYVVPSQLASVATPQYRLNEPQGLLKLDFEGDFSEACSFASNLQTDFQNSLRSRSFNIAEDWAVAADFLSGRLGRHCFQVGQFAGLIALRLGQSHEEATLVDLACRLHDIGKIAISESLHSAFNAGDVDAFSMTREHAIGGAELLGLSVEPVFVMAKTIARHHHEWWNGCGYPDALKEGQIPLEARICSIADYYSNLVCPPHNSIAWNVEDAMRQVISMSGFQFDPELIPAFIAATKDADRVGMYCKDAVDSVVYSVSLGSARRDLLKVVDSIE